MSARAFFENGKMCHLCKKYSQDGKVYSVCILKFSYMHYAIKPYINKQIVKMADENLTDYSCLSRYHYTKSKKYLKKTKFPCLLGHP